MKINIREELNNIDFNTYNQYDLLNMYESLDMSDEEKQELIKILANHEDPEVIGDYLSKKYYKQEFGGFDDKDMDDELKAYFKGFVDVEEKLCKDGEEEEDCDYDESLYEDKEEYKDDLDNLMANRGVKVDDAPTKSEIEFYEIGGKCPVEDFIKSISDNKLKEKTVKNIYQLAEEGRNARPPLSKYVSDGVFELRSKQSNNIDRIFFFFVVGNKIVMTNGYIKKSQDLDKKEFAKAKRYMNEYLGRNN